MHNRQAQLGLQLEQLNQLVRKEIKQRYKDTWLGFVWILLTPIIQSVVISFLFVRIIGTRSTSLEESYYPLIVLTGLIVWNFVSHTISQAMETFARNRELVLNQPISLLLLPLSHTIIKLLDYIIELIVLIGLVIWLLPSPSWSWLALAPFSLSLWLFVYGCATLSSLIFITIRDVGHLVSFFLSLWFWLSPIFYPAELIPSHFTFLNFNPLIHFLAAFRQIVLFNTVDLDKLSKLFLLGLLFALFSTGLFIWQRPRIYNRA